MSAAVNPHPENQELGDLPASTAGDAGTRLGIPPGFLFATPVSSALSAPDTRIYTEDILPALGTFDPAAQQAQRLAAVARRGAQGPMIDDDMFPPSAGDMVLAPEDPAMARLLYNEVAQFAREAPLGSVMVSMTGTDEQPGIRFTGAEAHPAFQQLRQLAIWMLVAHETPAYAERLVADLPDAQAASIYEAAAAGYRAKATSARRSTQSTATVIASTATASPQQGSERPVEPHGGVDPELDEDLALRVSDGGLIALICTELDRILRNTERSQPPMNDARSVTIADIMRSVAPPPERLKELARTALLMCDVFESPAYAVGAAEHRPAAAAALFRAGAVGFERNGHPTNAKKLRRLANITEKSQPIAHTERRVPITTDEPFGFVPGVFGRSMTRILDRTIPADESDVTSSANDDAVRRRAHAAAVDHDVAGFLCNVMVAEINLPPDMLRTPDELADIGRRRPLFVADVAMLRTPIGLRVDPIIADTLVQLADICYEPDRADAMRANHPELEALATHAEVFGHDMRNQPDAAEAAWRTIVGPHISRTQIPR